MLFLFGDLVNQSWDSAWNYLIPITLLCVGFTSYGLRELATIKFWELGSLVLVCNLPLHGIFFLSNARGLPIYLIILAAWIGLYFIRKDNKRIGCFSRDGYARLLGVGKKKGPLIKSISDLQEIDVLVLSANEFTSLKSNKESKLSKILLEALRQDIEVFTVSKFLQKEYGFIDAGGSLEAAEIGVQHRRILRGTKRVIDTFLAVNFLVMSFPILLLVTLAVYFIDGAPIFFRQLRLGKGGRPFNILKFRTMLPSENNNMQVTKIGSILRQTHFDEIPQLLNIIRGDMAFIGPRPEWVLLSTPKVAPKNYWMRQAIRPGLTGWAQVNYKPSRTKSMRKRKLGYDLYYLHNRTVFLDILIWFRTLLRLPMFFLSVFGK